MHLVAQHEVAYIVDRNRSDIQVMHEFNAPEGRFFKPFVYEMIKEDDIKTAEKKLSTILVDNLFKK